MATMLYYDTLYYDNGKFYHIWSCKHVNFETVIHFKKRPYYPFLNQFSLDEKKQEFKFLYLVKIVDSQSIYTVWHISIILMVFFSIFPPTFTASKNTYEIRKIHDRFIRQLIQYGLRVGISYLFPSNSSKPHKRYCFTRVNWDRLLLPVR